MDLPNNFNALDDGHLAEKASPESARLHQLFDGLPQALKTPNNMALLETYCLIPRISGRRFVQVLLARLAGLEDATPPQDDLAEAEYLLMHYAKLPTDDMRARMLSLVRQICVANGGDLEMFQEATSQKTG
jgi:hypothetical protein